MIIFQNLLMERFSGGNINRVNFSEFLQEIHCYYYSELSGCNVIVVRSVSKEMPKAVKPTEIPLFNIRGLQENL